MLNVFPDSSIPRGAITGTNPLAIESSMIEVLISVGSPTKPKSRIFSIFESLSLLILICIFFA